MKIFLLIILAFSIFLQADIPIENNAIISKHLKGNNQLIQELVQVIHTKGYTCTSIVSLVPFIFGDGYTLSCNNYDYTYELKKSKKTYTQNSSKWEVENINW